MTEERIGGLRTLAVQPPRSQAPTSAACIITILHGHAMRPEDLSPFAAAMRMPCAFYFPQGPVSAIDGGCSWWPIDEERRRGQLAQGPRDLSSESPSRSTIRQQLSQFFRVLSDRHGPSPNVLAGFSQGGMLACDLVLHQDVSVAALGLLSASRIALPEWMPRLGALQGLPVLISHGRADQDLAFTAGEALRDMAQGAGAITEWLPFDGGHEIPLVVWRQLKRLIMRVSTGQVDRL